MSRRKQSCPQHLENSVASISPGSESDSSKANNDSNLETKMTQSQNQTPIKEMKDSVTKSSVTRDESVPEGYVDLSKVKIEPLSTETNFQDEIAGDMSEQDPKFMYQKRSKEQQKSNISNNYVQNRKYKCNKCGISFSNKNTYKVHKDHYCQGRIHAFECNLCCAKFSKENMLKLHMKSHTKFTCTLCRSLFGTPDECEFHMASHLTLPNLTNEKSEKISIRCPGCSFSSNNLPELMIHIGAKHVIIETGEEKDQSLTPPKSSNVNGHSNKKLLTEANDFSLNISNLMPIKTSTPSRPLSAGSNSTPFSCIVCQLSFADIVALQRHLLIQHANLSNSVKTPASCKTLKSPVFTSNSLSSDNSSPEYNMKRTDEIQLSRKKRSFDEISESDLSNASKKHKTEPRGSSSGETSPEIDEQRHCIECAITFSSSVNYRAHKQYYCASRHPQRKHSLLSEKNSPVEKQVKKINTIKQRKDGNGCRKPKNILKDTDVINDEFEFGGVMPTVPNSKKHFCQECNIGFSKHDTYLAHKKYYCESRRKEKIAFNAEESNYNSNIKSTSNGSSTDCNGNIPEGMSSYLEKMKMSQMEQMEIIRKYLSMQEANIFQSAAAMDLMNPLNPMFANPFFINQYFNFLQEGGTIKLPTLNQATKDETTTNKIRTPSPGSMSEPTSKSLSQNEKKKDSSAKSIRSQSTSPLDLSKKTKNARTKVCPRENSLSPETVLGVDGNPCATIDLRKTSLNKFRFSENTNNNNNGRTSQHDKKASFSPPFPVCTSSSDCNNRAQQCRNCGAQFTNLSTFVAHKKFYCPGTSSLRHCGKTQVPRPTLAH